MHISFHHLAGTNNLSLSFAFGSLKTGVGMSASRAGSVDLTEDDGDHSDPDGRESGGGGFIVDDAATTIELDEPATNQPVVVARAASSNGSSTSAAAAAAAIAVRPAVSNGSGSGGSSNGTDSLKDTETKLKAAHTTCTATLKRIERDLASLMSEKHATLAKLATIETKLRELPQQMERERAKGIDWNADDFAWSNDVRSVLKSVFGLSDFRPMQKEVINLTMKGMGMYW